MNRVPMFFLGLLVLVLLLGVTMPLMAANATGKIASVAADKNEFAMADKDGKNWTFTLNEGGKVFINDKEAKLGDLQQGMDVAITYEKQGEKLLASEVRATKK